MGDTADRDSGTVIRFEEGIIGVPRARRFHLLEKPGSQLRVLRCLDIQGLALPVTDPRLADAAYNPDLGPRVAEALQIREGDPILVLAVTTLDGPASTANLRAPLVINTRRQLAAQIILDDRSYPLRAPVRLEG